MNKKNKTLPEYKQTPQDIRCAEPLLSAAYAHAPTDICDVTGPDCGLGLCVYVHVQEFPFIESLRHFILLFSLSWCGRSIFIFFLFKKQSRVHSPTTYMITLPKTHSKYCGDSHHCPSLKVPTVLLELLKKTCQRP